MKLFLVLFSLVCAPFVFSHEYFFAFAEMEYNDVSQKLETTLIISTHDFESIAESEGFSFDNIPETKASKENNAKIELYISKHFIINSGKSNCNMHLVGYETFLNGTSNLYFESDKVELANELVIEFDLFMDFHQGQQNKVTLYLRGESYTQQFIDKDRKKAIQLARK